jgi:AcrR family transcriptional regulator
VTRETATVRGNTVRGDTAGGDTAGGDGAADTASIDRPSVVGPKADVLIEATWAVVARSGHIEPGVREILEESGLSTQALYRSFGSKDELMLVALRRASDVLVEYLAHRVGSTPDPLAKVGEWIDGSLRQAVNPSAARRILPWTLGLGSIAARFPEQLERNREAIIAPLTGAIEEVVESGQGYSPDPADDARLIFAYTGHTVRHHLTRGIAPDADTTRRLTAFAHRTLGAQPRI